MYKTIFSKIIDLKIQQIWIIVLAAVLFLAYILLHQYSKGAEH